MAQDIGFRKTDKNKGAIGSIISDWTYNQDYLTILNDFQTRSAEFDKMEKSDPIVQGLMTSVYNPILSANWGINYENEDIEIGDAEQRIIDYGYQVFFEDLKFEGKLLQEILTYLPQGYAVFAKEFVKRNTTALGDYIGVKLPIRLQKTIKFLRFKDPKDLDLVTHLNQYFFSSKQQIDIDMPIEKLLIFTNRQIGNDITGTSLLRACYKPWIQKDSIEKMQMIGIEKEALGTPVLDLPKAYNPDDLEEAKTSMMSYMAHEKMGIVMPFGFVFRIEKGQFNSEAIDKAINQKNTEMAIRFLAQFLLLGQFGNGGAYSLGLDSSDFFLNSLEFFAKTIISNLNDLYKQLIIIQYGEQEFYPTFYVKGINNKASKELSETLKNLVEAGLLNPDERVTRFIRETYALPEEVEEEAEEVPVTPPEKPVEEIPEEDEDIEPPDADQIKDVDKNPPNLIKLQAPDINMVRLKESLFLKGITNNEQYIQNQYERRYLPVMEDLEEKVKKILNKGYAKSRKKFIGGAPYLTATGNRGVMNDMRTKVREQFQKFKNRTASPAQMNKIMKGALKNAEETNNAFYGANEIKLAIVSMGQYAAFISGHRSNMFAVVDNEERRILENITNNFGSELSLDTIEKQVNLIKLNRNTYKLSVTAHPRGLYKQEIEKNAMSRGIQNFKMMVAKGTELDPSGTTMGSLFLIKSIYDWEKKTEDSQNGSGVVGGLGIHHNSEEYFEPIADNELGFQRQISREQRSPENLAKFEK